MASTKHMFLENLYEYSIHECVNVKACCVCALCVCTCKCMYIYVLYAKLMSSCSQLDWQGHTRTDTRAHIHANLLKLSIGRAF